MFDFDGTIVDTEAPAFRSWQELFEENGQTLTLDAWSGCLGTIGGFDPLLHLEELIGTALEDRDDALIRRGERNLHLLASERLRPGVDEYLVRAGELGLEVAIVSSDTTEWITTNLARVGRSEGWAHIVCADGDVARAKPLPCLYEEALELLGMPAESAIAFEDSPNGIRAAKAAGLFCVAVPNPVTKDLDLGAADLALDSLEDMALDEVLRAAVRV